MDWRSLPSLVALRAFAALAETGGFTAAGAALGVSHAAVSQQVRALEEWLGAPLVARGGGRRVELTPEGARLATALGGAFLDIRRAVDEILGAGADRPLQVTLTPAFAHAWLMPRLAAFLQASPGVQIMLNPTQDVVALGPGGADVAIRHGHGGWAGVEAEWLAPAGFVIVAAPALIRGRTIRTPADLLDLPWVEEIGAAEVRAWLRGQGVEGPPREAVTHLPSHLTHEATRAGLGVTVASRPVVERDIAAGRLVELWSAPGDGSGYWIVTRPGVKRPPLRAFIAWLRRQVPPAAPGP